MTADAVQDGRAVGNSVSNVLRANHSAGHNAKDGVYLANNFVPWGETVCLTPEDTTQTIVLSTDDCKIEVARIRCHSAQVRSYRTSLK